MVTNIVRNRKTYYLIFFDPHRRLTHMASRPVLQSFLDNDILIMKLYAGDRTTSLQMELSRAWSQRRKAEESV